MADPERRNDGDLISKLIAAEEENALARFRASHFEDRLRSRIVTGLARRSRPPGFRAGLRPVWISAVGLVVLGSLVLVFLLHRPQVPRSVITVEIALRHLPGIQALEMQPPGGLDITSLSDSPLDQSIAIFLSTWIRPERTPPVGDRRPAVPSFNPDRKPLDLQELYDWLIMNKSVERVLTLVSSKPKEG
jgi:hypothetical protein